MRKNLVFFDHVFVTSSIDTMVSNSMSFRVNECVNPTSFDPRPLELLRGIKIQTNCNISFPENEQFDVHRC